jgi:hypothetical protein
MSVITRPYTYEKVDQTETPEKEKTQKPASWFGKLISALKSKDASPAAKKVTEVWQDEEEIQSLTGK